LLNDIQVFDSKGLNIGKMDILIAGIILANGYCEILKKKRIDLTEK
jgi:hypothetical protein